MLLFKERLDMMNEMQEDMHILLYILENEYEHTETELNESVDSWLKKAGLKIHKEKGLINYVADFTKGGGQLLLAAIKGDKNKVKEIAGQMEKANVVDFLLKLDMATLHIVMGPVHFIDAVTGWDLTANIQQKAKGAGSMIDAFKAAIQKVKETVIKISSGTKRKRLLKHLAHLDQSVA